MASIAHRSSWLAALWHVATGWTAAVCLVVGARRFRPEAMVAWYLFSTGVFLGDASYRWASDMGAGNDTVDIGPSVSSGLGEGLGLYAGDGNDTVYAVNGTPDDVECGAGQDTFFADPFDQEQLYSVPVPPCERRVAPSVQVPGT